jgi:peptide/nickel transport system substrate-binding protein
MQYGHMSDRSTRSPRTWWQVVAVLFVALLLAAACGSSDDGDETGSGGEAVSPDVTQPESEEVTTGGKLVYGLEAETSGYDPTTDRWAISGNMVAQAIYDPLSAYDAEGNIQPYLAESFVPNDDFTEWTINLRPNIQFHNGEPLTAAAAVATMNGVKESLLTGGAFRAIDTITAVPGNDLAVLVTMLQPWASFPATLVGQAGVIIAPEQFNASAEAKSRVPIGTGPFKYDNWVPDNRFEASKNPNYWMTDDQGRKLPYLDEVEFRPIPDVQTRESSLEANDISVMHTSSDPTIVSLRAQAQSGSIQAVEDRGENEETFILLNASAPPFDNATARQALAAATDTDTYLATFQIDASKKTNSAFGKDSPFYSDNPFPTYDPERARQLVADYTAQTGQPLSFTLGTTPVPVNEQVTQLLQQQYEAVGMQVDPKSTEQGQFITDAVQGNYQANLWRQFGATDPDADYVWWHQSNATGPLALNIARYQNAEVSAALDEARATPDPEARKEAYATVQRIWGEQGPYIWLNTTTWIIAAQNDVRHFWNNALPNSENVADIASLPFQSGTHRVTQTWIDTASG